MKRLMTAFPLLCALLALSPRANAQNNTSENFCPGDCVPMGQICADRWPGHGAVYNTDPMVPSTCPATCTPTREQCSHMLVTCPTRDNCTDQPAGGGGQATTPRPPRAPHTPRVVPNDICETGAHPDPSNPDTCVCNDGADGGPIPVYQPGMTHHVHRLQQRDAQGHLHVMCVIPPQPPAQTDNGPVCGELSVCGETCRDLQHDPNNCGSCGHACGRGELCNDGSCVAREQAAPTPPVPATPSEGGQAIARNMEQRLTAVEARPQVMFGLHAALSMLHVSLPGESAFTLLNPALGGSLRVNWPTGPNLSFELFAQVGWTNTGHVCDAVTVEGGLRAGWAIGDRRIVTPHVGWSGWLAYVPCHPPTGGDQVADGVASATGPTIGATVRIWDGLHVGAEFRWTPFSRYTETWSRDFTGVAPVGGNIWLGYRFFGP
jgi:hypothetical protein